MMKHFKDKISCVKKSYVRGMQYYVYLHKQSMSTWMLIITFR